LTIIINDRERQPLTKVLPQLGLDGSLNEVLNSNMLYLDIGGSNKYYRGFYKAIFSARNRLKLIDKAFIIDKINATEFL
jgi:hypothetical protein